MPTPAAILPPPPRSLPDLDPRIALAVRLVAKAYELQPDELFEKTRRAPVPEARQLVMALLTVQLEMTRVEVGRVFDFDHGTVCHGLKFVANQVDVDNAFLERHDALQDRFERELRELEADPTGRVLETLTAVVNLAVSAGLVIEVRRDASVVVCAQGDLGPECTAGSALQMAPHIARLVMDATAPAPSSPPHSLTP